LTSSDVKLILLSGPPYSGKTTVTETLAAKPATVIVRAREVLLRNAQGNLGSRKDLQSFGAEVEVKSGGAWLADAVKGTLAGSPNARIVVDAVRTSAQRDHLLRLGMVSSHIHLTASPEVRAERFSRQIDPLDSGETGFDEVISHNTERRADDLRAVADLVIDTSALTADVVREMVLLFLGQ
jgi:cytidylate kinase